MSSAVSSIIRFFNQVEMIFVAHCDKLLDFKLVFLAGVRKKRLKMLFFVLVCFFLNLNTCKEFKCNCKFYGFVMKITVSYNVLRG